MFFISPKTKIIKKYFYSSINLEGILMSWRDIMIEDYIEKDILRQVKIIEYFFDLEYMNLKELSDNLNVTSETIRRDFSRIETILGDKVKNIKIELSVCQIEFLSEYSHYELVKEIYKESKFLRVCSRYIMGTRDYLSIVEEEFISVSKAFQLKKKVEIFFSQFNYLDEQGSSNEFMKRFLTLSVWMRCDLLDENIDEKCWILAENFTNSLLSSFSNNLSKREFIFFVKSVYIMLSESKKRTLSIPKIAFDYMKKSVITEKISNLVYEFFDEETKKNITLQEIIYLSIIFRMVPYNVNNYTLLKMDYEYQRQRIIEAFPDISQLILSFEREFEVSLIKNIRFEKPLFTFILSNLLETQNFVVDKHYFLSGDRLILRNKITGILNNWKKINGSNKHMLSNIAIDRFCIEVSSILLPQFSQHRFIVVIAENEDAHIEYRESIETYISGTDMILDNVMYYSLEDLPAYYENYIIICEHHLLHETRINENNLIFSISLNYLDRDLKNIFTKIYFDIEG